MLNIIRVKKDEYLVAKICDNKAWYLSKGWKRSPWKSDWIIFFTENDATSALIIKRRRWEEPQEEPEAPKVEKPVQSWSELS